MIIDTHAHLGTSKFTGNSNREEELLAAMDRHGVTASLVMPQPTDDDTAPVHDRIAALAQAHPGRIYGVASVNPWLPDEQYEAEVRRAVEQLGFVAIKLNTLGYNMSPVAPQAAKIFRLANKLGVPVIVHTGLGAPAGLPALCIAPARQYPDLPIVLAHAGHAVYTAEALVAAQTCPNIYLEPSWCTTYQVAGFVQALGADRLMMGSDHVANLPVELVRYRSIGLSEEQLHTIFAVTPQRVFGLPGLWQGGA